MSSRGSSLLSYNRFLFYTFWIKFLISSLVGITRSAPFLVVIRDAAAFAKVSISFRFSSVSPPTVTLCAVALIPSATAANVKKIRFIYSSFFRFPFKPSVASSCASERPQTPKVTKIITLLRIFEKYLRKLTELGNFAP